MEHLYPTLLLAAGLLGLAACSSPSAEKDAKSTPAMNQPASPPPAADAAPAADLTYTPTPDDQRAALADYSQQQPGSTPAAAEKFAAMFGPGGQADYGPLYAKLLANSGLHENDVIDAFAAYVVITYQVARGEAATLPAGSTVAVRHQFAPLVTRMLAGKPAGTTAQLGELMKLQAVLVFVGAQQPSDQFRQNVARKFAAQYKFDVTALTLTDQGLAGKDGTVASFAAPAAAPAPAAASSAAAASGTGLAAGAQWFFRSRSGGSGVTFEPVALLANGQYCDVGEAPLESVDAAADQARHPYSWGTWRKNGGTFVLTGEKGHSVSYVLGDGSWFPAYEAGATPLKRRYQSTSGSSMPVTSPDGSMGMVSTMSIQRLTFVDDTHFTDGAEGGAITPNAAASSRRKGGGGTYHLQGHTLTLTYADGRTVQKSFAIGAEGTPLKPSNNIIFIGGDTYTENKE